MHACKRIRKIEKEGIETAWLGGKGGLNNKSIESKTRHCDLTSFSVLVRAGLPASERRFPNNEVEIEKEGIETAWLGGKGGLNNKSIESKTRHCDLTSFSVLVRAGLPASERRFPNNEVEIEKEGIETAWLGGKGGLNNKSIESKTRHCDLTSFSVLVRAGLPASERRFPNNEVDIFSTFR